MSIVYGPAEARHKAYCAFYHARARCQDPEHPNYGRYGGRGIRISRRWAKSFDAFIKAVGLPPGREYVLDRIDNDDGYKPGNVRWATHLESIRNRSNTRFYSYRGQRRCVAEWATIYKINLRTLYSRLNRGWTIERALEEPVRSDRKDRSE